MAAQLGLAKGAEPANKGQRYPAEPLTEQEAERLIAALSSRSATGLRNRALLVVLYRSGLRLDEALQLRVSAIDPDSGSIRVLHGKGNRARTSYVDSGGMAVVQRWIDARRGLGIRANGHPLFCTLGGDPLSPVYVRNLVKRLAAKAGIDKRVHPHGLRHTHATELAADGVPINIISKQLGHSSSAVTARYLDHVSNDQVREAIAQRQWAAPA